jgi:hypothetical protein
MYLQIEKTTKKVGRIKTESSYKVFGTINKQPVHFEFDRKDLAHTGSYGYGVSLDVNAAIEAALRSYGQVTEDQIWFSRKVSHPDSNPETYIAYEGHVEGTTRLINAILGEKAAKANRALWHCIENYHRVPVNDLLWNHNHRWFSVEIPPTVKLVSTSGGIIGLGSQRLFDAHQDQMKKYFNFDFSRDDKWDTFDSHKEHFESVFSFNCGITYFHAKKQTGYVHQGENSIVCLWAGDINGDRYDTRTLKFTLGMWSLSGELDQLRRRIRNQKRGHDPRRILRHTSRSASIH